MFLCLRERIVWLEMSFYESTERIQTCFLKRNDALQQKLFACRSRLELTSSAGGFALVSSLKSPLLCCEPDILKVYSPLWNMTISVLFSCIRHLVFSTGVLLGNSGLFLHFYGVQSNQNNSCWDSRESRIKWGPFTWQALFCFSRCLSCGDCWRNVLYHQQSLLFDEGCVVWRILPFIFGSPQHGKWVAPTVYFGFVCHLDKGINW